MAQRPVFASKNTTPFYDIVNIEFVYNQGFALSQKQKNITAIHSGFQNLYPDKKVLEISSKSMQKIGIELSAFNLLKYVPSIEKKIHSNAYDRLQNMVGLTDAKKVIDSIIAYAKMQRAFRNQKILHKGLLFICALPEIPEVQKLLSPVLSPRF